jgi:Ras-related protein Rab-6A
MFGEKIPEGVGGPDCLDFPKGRSSAPVVWTYLGSPIDLSFTSGFFGATQDNSTGVITPVVGWLITKDEEKEKKRHPEEEVQEREEVLKKVLVPPPRRRGMEAYKVVILGDQSVGKTSIITRFLYNAFESTYQATIGIDFVCKVLPLPDRSVKIQFWDTAGQERFRSLIPSYLRDAAGCVVVYDVTNRKSFDSVEGWVNDAKRERPDVVIALVGNKQDVEESKREVSEEEGNELARRLELSVFRETSAKTGKNIQEVIKDVGMALPNPTESKDGTAARPNPPVEEKKITLSAGKQRVVFNNCC